MLTVLIVEDEEHLCATLVYNLRKAGYEVQTAASGPEAALQYRATSPDLVLLDVMQPGYDGFEVCRRIRQISLPGNSVAPHTMTCQLSPGVPERVQYTSAQYRT